MRVNEPLIARFRADDVIAPGLDIVCDLLAIAALIGIILIEFYKIAASATVVPDIKRLCINVIIGVTVVATAHI
jgi:hypothetical protein